MQCGESEAAASVYEPYPDKSKERFNFTVLILIKKWRVVEDAIPPTACNSRRTLPSPTTSISPDNVIICDNVHPAAGTVLVPEVLVLNEQVDVDDGGDA